MGKRRRSKNNNNKRVGNHHTHDSSNQSGNKKKRRRRSQSYPKKRFWIQECSEIQPPNASHVDFHITISRIELTDDHVHQADRKDEKTAVAVEQDTKPSPSMATYSDKDHPDKAKAVTVLKSDLVGEAEEGTNTTSSLQTIPSNHPPPESPDEVIQKSSKPPATLMNAPQQQQHPVTAAATVVAGDVPESSHDDKTFKKDDTFQQYKSKESTIESSHTSKADNTTTTTTARDDNEDEDGDATAPVVLAITRHASAQVPPKQFPNIFHRHANLPNGNNGDGIVNPFPEVPNKYWAQRHRLFSKFDDGIQLDQEGWYSVTPETIAKHITKRIVNRSVISSATARDSSLSSTTNMTTTTSPATTVIMDPFCGCGGNVIAFANDHDTLVVAMDMDRTKLEAAAHNAHIYQVPPDKMVLIHGNACEALLRYQDGKLSLQHQPTDEKSASSTNAAVTSKTIHGYQIGGLELLPKHIDAIFLSPPWGGPDYAEKQQYHVESCITVRTNDETNDDDNTINGAELLHLAARACTQKVIYFLPRNINGQSLGRVAHSAGFQTMEMEQQFLNDKLKTVTAYIGF